MFTSRLLEEQSFDRWVRNSLRERYAAVLHEPVPDALLRLLTDVPDSE